MSSDLGETSRFQRLQTRLASCFGLVLGLVFVLALSLRLIYLNQMDQGIYFNILKMEGFDSFIFWKWALEILEKDFFGRGVYHQSPLYPYFLAAIFKLSGANFYIPRFIQIVLGSITCVMAAILGRRAGGALSGLLAGILCAAYGPLILYDPAILREGLITFLNTLLLLLMFRCQDKPRFASGLALGVTFGLAILAKESILIMLPVLPVWLYLNHTTVPGLKPVTLMSFGFVLGTALILSLLVARNLKVGAPAFEISSRGPLEFISGNVPDSPGVGWVIPPSSDRMLQAGEGKMTKVVWEVLKENRPNPWWLVRHQFTKLAALLNSYEFPNNLSLYVEQRYVPFFRFPWPGWAVALALGVIGMGAGLKRWRELFPLHAYVFLYALATVAFYIIDRFRLPVVPALLAFAGLGLAVILQAILEKRAGRAIALILLAAGLIALNRPSPADRLLYADYYNMARYHLISGQPDQAKAVLEEGIARTREILEQKDSAEYRYRLALLLLLNNENRPAILAEVDRALSLNPPLWIKLSLEQMRRQL